ncbi:MAG TPA: iron-containing redox enzyme family protein [Candidatus Dormibacteraeota bacterium]|jgi:pyrroloquinoline-quinone synthase|nr:iron-containing redox enzyme family protein [Candidatus Dormibacteraeota bacterium]
MAARLDDVLTERLDGRRLLDHPFYRRWSRGEVSIEELRAYAAQYRHFEAALPGHLRSVADSATDEALREQALRNLDDEQTHLALFDGFVSALGDAAGTETPASPAMADLLDVYRRAAERSAAEGFAALLAYEVQSSGVAASKAAGLREHGILDGDGLGFWDLHATLDADHAAWATDVLSRSDVALPVLADAIGSAAGAWWAFLDEREAMRA